MRNTVLPRLVKMPLSSFSVAWAFALGWLMSQAGARPAWTRYSDEEPYYEPKMQYYLERAHEPYSAAYPEPHPEQYPDSYHEPYPEPYQQTYPEPYPAAYPEVFGHPPRPNRYDPYGHYTEEDLARQEERLAALPVGQETWYEGEAEPGWRAADLDEVKATFLDNLILTQMAQDAQRRRGLARPPPADYEDADEDVRELRALAARPHRPPPAPAARHDYPADDAFINWNGYKRSVTTAAPSTPRPRLGQDEVMVPRPGHAAHDHAAHDHAAHDHAAHRQHQPDSVYDQITQLLAAEAKSEHKESRRIRKRFVSGEADLAAELRGLKRRMT